MCRKRFPPLTATDNGRKGEFQLNILIVGCGKVGSGLANSLDKMGHDLAVVDAHPENFDRLDEGFSGYTIQGVPIDTDVLKQAGIEACDFLVAVCEDDNINIMVSQIAREIFKVPKVLARIFDPRRKNVFAQFGLEAVCPTSLTVDAIERAVENERAGASFAVGSTNITTGQMEIPKSCLGLTLEEMSHDSQEMAVGVVRAGGEVVLRDADPLYRMEEGDKLLVVRTI